jgi:hypothetical protein
MNKLTAIVENEFNRINNIRLDEIKNNTKILEGLLLKYNHENNILNQLEIKLIKIKIDLATTGNNAIDIYKSYNLYLIDSINGLGYPVDSIKKLLRGY